jgi:hypothetical protein
MASCLGCGKDMTEVSRKIMKGQKAGASPNYKVTHQCKNETCKNKGLKISFLDDGMMMIPLPDGQ